jgi:hypothetical protein
LQDIEPRGHGNSHDFACPDRKGCR